MIPGIFVHDASYPSSPKGILPLRGEDVLMPRLVACSNQTLKTGDLEAAAESTVGALIIRIWICAVLHTL